MRHSKIAIIGAGAVGSTTAYALMLRSIASEIMLIDINEQRCKGEVDDLADAISFSDTSRIISTTIDKAKQADIIIIAAGIAQKKGQARSELIKTNKKIVTSIINDIKPIRKETIIIMVTNPVDAMTFYAHQHSGLPHTQIFGTGTFLDSQRLRGFISQKLNIAEQSIHAYIIGEHGDSQFPAWSTATIGGIPLPSFPGITKQNLDTFAIEARQKVYEIINCKGATFFGIAACVSAICKNILFNQRRIAPVSVFLEKSGVYTSMPAVLGRNGIEQILPIKLNKEEKDLMEQSIAKIKKLLE